MRWMLLFLLLASCGIDDSNEEWLRLEAIKSEAVSEHIELFDRVFDVYYTVVCWDKNRIMGCTGWDDEPGAYIEECRSCKGLEILYSGWRQGHKYEYDE